MLPPTAGHCDVSPFNITLRCFLSPHDTVMCAPPPQGYSAMEKMMQDESFSMFSLLHKQTQQRKLTFAILFILPTGTCPSLPQDAVMMCPPISPGCCNVIPPSTAGMCSHSGRRNVSFPSKVAEEAAEVQKVDQHAPHPEDIHAAVEALHPQPPPKVQVSPSLHLVVICVKDLLCLMNKEE